MYKSLALFFILQSCSAKIIYSNQKRSDPFLQWDISEDKKNIIIQELQKQSTLKQKDPKIAKKYYYKSVVTNSEGSGLYELTNYSHRGPVSVIMSENLVTVIEEVTNKEAFVGSIQVAIEKHGRQLSSKLKNEIVKELLKAY